MVLACTLLLTACSGFRNLPPDQRRAVIVTLDGGAERIIERMLAEGAMPNLAQLRARGAWADYSLTNYPSKTAAGHAALWTGAFSDVNGITCNKVFKLPAAAHSIRDVEDGFDSRALLAEPIWVTAARAGKRALVLQGTHASPFQTWEPGGRFGGPFRGSLTLVDGFSGVAGHDGVVRGMNAWRPASGWTEPPAGSAPVREPMEARVPMGDRTWWAYAWDDPADPVVGYDTLSLAPHKAAQPTRLKPGAWTNGLPVDTRFGPSWLQFHLFTLDPKLEDWLLYYTPATRARGNKQEAADGWFPADAPFMPKGPGGLWTKGDLGPSVFNGGDGTAEQRYLTVTRRLTDLARKRMERLVARRDWDLAVYYLPFPDETLHHFYGACDDQSPIYNPALAAKVWPTIAQACRQVDAALAPLLVARDTTIAVGADHGMAGTHATFHPNLVLRQAGLLVLGKDGQPDLKRTKALYPALDGAFVVVNKVGRKGGIVKATDVPKVLGQVEAAFRNARGPGGQPLVTGTLRADTDEARGLGIGGPRAGDVYIDLAPGFYFDPRLDAKALTAPMDPGRAGHVYDPRRPDMHAIMGFAGPGVKAGVALGPVRNSDLAPTVCALLGIPAPAQATGRVLREALVETR